MDQVGRALEWIGPIEHLLVVLVVAIVSYDVGFRHGRDAQLEEEKRRG